MFLKTYDTESDEIIITIADQTGRLLEVEDKLIWHCFLINTNDTLFYRITRIIHAIEFDKYGEKLLDTTTKTELDAAKTTSKKVIHKIAKETGELIANKIA